MQVQCGRSNHLEAPRTVSPVLGKSCSNQHSRCCHRTSTGPHEERRTSRAELPQGSGRGPAERHPLRCQAHRVFQAAMPERHDQPGSPRKAATIPAASMPRPASRWMRMRDPSGLNNSIVAPATVLAGAIWSSVAGSLTKVGLTKSGFPPPLASRSRKDL